MATATSFFRQEAKAKRGSAHPAPVVAPAYTEIDRDEDIEIGAPAPSLVDMARPKVTPAMVTEAIARLSESDTRKLDRVFTEQKPKPGARRHTKREIIGNLLDAGQTLDDVTFDD